MVTEAAAVTMMVTEAAAVTMMVMEAAAVTMMVMEAAAVTMMDMEAAAVTMMVMEAAAVTQAVTPAVTEDAHHSVEGPGAARLHPEVVVHMPLVVWGTRTMVSHIDNAVAIRIHMACPRPGMHHVTGVEGVHGRAAEQLRPEEQPRPEELVPHPRHGPGVNPGVTPERRVGEGGRPRRGTGRRARAW